MSEIKKILTTGDYCSDYDIYLSTDEDNPLPGTPPAQIRVSVGGAGISYRVLKSLQAQLAKKDKKDRCARDIETAFWGNPGSFISPPTAGLWQKFAFGKLGKTTDDEKAKVWRVRRSLSLGQVAGSQPLPPAVLPDIAPESFKPNIVVVEDNVGGFRFRVPKWLENTDKNNLPDWIIFKTSAPICHGAFWWALVGSPEFCDRLVVVVSIRDLRKSEIRVSQGISWERTALDLARELTQSPLMEGLRRAKHVVVTMYGDGALWMERKEPGANETDLHQFTLFFDPGYMEEEWAQQICGAEGDAYGFHSAFAASVAANLALQDKNGLKIGIENGLRAMRLLRSIGHGYEKEPDPELPVDMLASTILADSDKPPDIMPEKPKADLSNLGKLGQAIVPSSALNEVATSAKETSDPCSPPAKWRILEASDSRPSPDQPLYGLGRRVALLGLKGLANVPYASFGKLFTADRDEIEALRNIQRLMQDYQKNESETKPLSIAVFGPPGAGKSFAIEQIAETALPGKKSFLKFNLSQFKDNQDLIGAFHQVRDKVLEGGLPIVFLDEFDSQNYKWLQYLLAPMQDGKFQEGQITHPIGRCILVFAGATCYNMQSFGPPEAPWAQTEEVLKEHKQATADFRLKKGPDFKSRLHGNLNVLGPNRRQCFNPAKPPGEQQWEDDPTDVCFPVRRAIMLRSWLGIMDPKKKQSWERLDMDSGLLAALLEVDHYKYGARSMEKIVLTVKQGSKGKFHRSALPTNEVLEMNVRELGQFMEILEQSRVFQQHAWRLAPAIHAAWFPLASQKNEYKTGFEQLKTEGKYDNYTAAVRIPEILGLVGLQLVEEKDSQPAVENAAEILGKHSEILAEEEHIGWMDVKQANGWQSAPFPKNEDEMRAQRDNHQNYCIRPYSELWKEDKDKDRRSIQNYSTVAALAEFKIVARKPLAK
jgi:hypothetical protein